MDFQIKNDPKTMSELGVELIATSDSFSFGTLTLGIFLSNTPLALDA
jgi:hypothetical protein